MPDANGKFKGIAVPRLPWKEPVACDACGLENPRDEQVEVTVESPGGGSISTVYLCDPCAHEAGL